MSGPVTRRGSAEYNRTVKGAERRLDDRIKLHANAIKNIEQRGNPTHAKPGAAMLHRSMMKAAAKQSNLSRTKR